MSQHRKSGHSLQGLEPFSPTGSDADTARRLICAHQALSSLTGEIASDPLIHDEAAVRELRRWTLMTKLDPDLLVLVEEW